MPAFNAAKTIESSIKSVLGQSYQNWELIVIDDGSMDNTIQFLNNFCEQDQRIKLLRLPQNGGLPNARNQGCKIAKGSWIAFLDSDDLWHTGKLEQQVDFHLKNPSIEISHTDFQLFNDNGTIRRSFKSILEPIKEKQGSIYPGVCYRNPIGVLTVMASSRLLKEVGYFDSSLWTLEDQELWIRIARKGYQFGYIDKELAYYRSSSGSITSKTGKYKRAYKFLLNKLNKTYELDNRLLFRQYYRHFGTVYFKKGLFKLSLMYFWKSLRLFPYDWIALSTILYIVYSIVLCNRNIWLRSIAKF